MQNIATIGDNLPPNDAEVLQSTLLEKHAPVFTGADKLIAAADRIPMLIEDDETAGRASDFMKMVNSCRKNIETIRVGEKEPYLTLGRVVDGFFRKTTDRLDTAFTRAKNPLDTYLKKKAAEEQRRRNEEAAALRAKADEEARAAKMLEDAKMRPEAEKMVDQAIITEQAANAVAESANARPAEMAKSRGITGAMASLRTRWVGEIECIELINLNALAPYIHPDAVQKAINLYVAAGGRELKGAKIYEKSDTVVR